MSFDDAGTFEITTPGQPVSPHTTISSTNFNALMQDVAAGLSNTICRDGQSEITANIPMNGKKFTGLALGTASTDSASMANIQAGTGVYVATVGGTADVITLSPSPAITAYAAGQTFRFIAPGTNTTNVTVNVSSLGAKAITKNGSSALVAGDLPSGAMATITYDGTRFIIGTTGASTYLPLSGGGMLGNILFLDNTYDIGASGANRPRNLYLSGDAAIGDAVTIGGDVAITGGLSVTGTLSGVLASGGAIYRLTISNNASDATNDIDIAYGTATSDDSVHSDRVSIILPPTGLTKRLDAAWAVGSNQGFLDTGSIANTTYHVWLILRPDTGVVDALASTSATSPTMPTNYTKKRRIGSFIRSGGAILPFTQDGDDFTLTTPVLDVNSTNPGSSAVLAALTVPLGLNVCALMNGYFVSSGDATAEYMHVSDPATTDQAPSATAAPLAQFAGNNSFVITGELRIRTNTSAQVRYRCSGSDGSTIVRLCTRGWTDTRGRNA